MAPALSAITVEGLDSAELQGMVFSHLYEPPRGEEGAPLMAITLWFPIAAPPVETLTLPQVIYRSLGSVRKPFRRTRLLFPDEARLRAVYTELLEWAADWAESSLGASLVPIPLSLRRLAGNSRSLEGLGCREILEMGMALTGASCEELTARIEAGNAWILLEDDRGGDEDLKPVKQALDAVFGAAGLPDVAIVVLSARKDCDILSDVQTFSQAEPQEPYAPGEPRASEPPEAMVRPWTSLLCRILARLGSPGARLVLAVRAVLGLSFLTIVMVGYEELIRLSSSFFPLGMRVLELKQDVPITELPFFLYSWMITAAALMAAYILGSAAMLAPLVAGYRWGMPYGSEEVRRASLQEWIFSTAAFLSLFLLLLPKSMDPGLWKAVCIALAALPAALFVPLALLGALVQAANILWLVLSLRISDRLGAAGLAILAERHRLVLHIAHFEAALPVPHGRNAGSRLPLLVAVANREILTGLLPFFPSLARQLRTVVLTGIRKDSGPYSVAAASLVLEALLGKENDECRSCLRHLASGCTAAWPRREEFDVYRRPSSTFRMNALEYVARRLCYLTNLEELIVVR